MRPLADHLTDIFTAAVFVAAGLIWSIPLP